MADERPNSQSSQLDEEDLNKVGEAVSENNAWLEAPCKVELLATVCCWRVKLARLFLQYYAKLPIHKLYN